MTKLINSFGTSVYRIMIGAKRLNKVRKCPLPQSPLLEWTYLVTSVMRIWSSTMLSWTRVSSTYSPHARTYALYASQLTAVQDVVVLEVTRHSWRHLNWRWESELLVACVDPQDHNHSTSEREFGEPYCRYIMRVFIDITNYWYHISNSFLADRTNGRAIATLLRLSSSSVCRRL